MDEAMSDSYGPGRSDRLYTYTQLLLAGRGGKAAIPTRFQAGADHWRRYRSAGELFSAPSAARQPRQPGRADRPRSFAQPARCSARNAAERGRIPSQERNPGRGRSTELHLRIRGPARTTRGVGAGRGRRRTRGRHMSASGGWKLSMGMTRKLCASSHRLSTTSMRASV